MRETKTMVKKGATIGANATIVCGHIIGRYALLGVEAVATRDVLDSLWCWKIVPELLVGCVNVVIR